MYEFADTTAEHDLAAAAKRGVTVHVILDRREQSENATAYYPTSRDFLVIDTSRPDVSAITAVFYADFAHRAVRPGDGSDLVGERAD